MTWTATRAWLGTLIRLVLGVVWIWASLSKLHDPRTFVQAIRIYDATPEWLTKAIGYGMPVLEFCLGVLLIAGVAVRIAAAVSGVLFLVFLIGLIQAAARGIKLSCGCFGGGGAAATTHYPLEILRDVGLLVLAAYLVAWSFSRISVEEYLARHDNVALPSAKRMRDPAAMRKYNAMLELRRKEARSRALYLNSSLAVTVVLVSVIGIGVQSGRAKISGDVTATNATVANGVVYGKAAAATVDVYEDFQCPVCLHFEQATHAVLQQDVKANLAQVRYHTISILDEASGGNRYSSRAANAALCASDVSVDFFIAYHDVLYGTDRNGKQVQPAENSGGRSDADLITYATYANIPAASSTTFGTCVHTEQHKSLVAAITDRASQHAINATPAVFVNGKQLKANDLATLEAAIAAADKAGPAPSPSPSATPTPTPSVTPTTSATPKASASK